MTTHRTRPARTRPRPRPRLRGLAPLACAGLCAWLLVVGIALAAPAAAGHRPELSGELAMTGDVGDYRETPDGVVDDPVHDPTLFADRSGGSTTYYVFSTGAADPDDPGGIFARRSTGTLAGPWESLGALALPEWTRAYDVDHLWAPHVVRTRDGVFHLYYSASSFGTNRSAIGTATTRTPGDLASWVDHGPVVTSELGGPYNAIDPDVYRAGGHWWMAYGSFFGGVVVQQLADDLRTPVGEPALLARNSDDPVNAIENPQVFRHGQWWYLTASWGLCCRGVDSTYSTVVGRSGSPTGPFVDRDGRPLAEGGGTPLLSRRGDQVGTGALDVLRDGHRLWAVHHYYDAATGGTIRMQVREVEWDDAGWPTFSSGDGDS